MKGEEGAAWIPSGEAFHVGANMYDTHTEFWCVDHTGLMTTHIVERKGKLSWLRYKCWASAGNGPASPVAEQDIKFNYYK